MNAEYTPVLSLHPRNDLFIKLYKTRTSASEYVYLETLSETHQVYVADVASVESIYRRFLSGYTLPDRPEDRIYTPETLRLDSHLHDGFVFVCGATVAMYQGSDVIRGSLESLEKGAWLRTLSYHDTTVLGLLWAHRLGRLNRHTRLNRTTDQNNKARTYAESVAQALQSLEELPDWMEPPHGYATSYSLRAIYSDMKAAWYGDPLRPGYQPLLGMLTQRTQPGVPHEEVSWPVRDLRLLRAQHDLYQSYDDAGVYCLYLDTSLPARDMSSDPVVFFAPEQAAHNINLFWEDIHAQCQALY